MKMIELFVPLEDDTFLATMKGDKTILFKDKYFKGVFSFLKGHDKTGNFTQYVNVYEISFGMETFMPSSDSNPTFGELDEAQALYSVKVSIFLDSDISKTEMISFIENLSTIHPWEHPVMTLRYNDKFFYSKKMPVDFVKQLELEL